MYPERKCALQVLAAFLLLLSAASCAERKTRQDRRYYGRQDEDSIAQQRSMDRSPLQRRELDHGVQLVHERYPFLRRAPPGYASEVSHEKTHDERSLGERHQTSSFSSRHYHTMPKESEEEESDGVLANYTRRRYSVSPSGLRLGLNDTESGVRPGSRFRGSVGIDGLHEESDHGSELGSGRTTHIWQMRHTTHKAGEDLGGDADKSGLTQTRRVYHVASMHDGLLTDRMDESRASGTGRQVRLEVERGVGEAHEARTQARDLGVEHDSDHRTHQERHSLERHREETAASRRYGESTLKERRIESQRRYWDGGRQRADSTDSSRRYSPASDTEWRRYRYSNRTGEDPSMWRGSGTDRPGYSRTSYTRWTNGTRTSHREGGTYSYTRWTYGGRENVSTPAGSSVSYGSSRTSGTYGGTDVGLESHSRTWTTPPPAVVTHGWDMGTQRPVITSLLGEEKRHPLAGSRGQYGRRCDESSCYPATGNLLIGRENKLSATSTCGTRHEERYCIVSHLKERKKCFKCNALDRNKEHGIQNIVSRAGSERRKTWWQSENGVEKVSIRLDTEAEFHFTHLIITFRTFRPAAMLIERSHDNGRTWKVYQYYAYNCAESFPGIPIGPRRNITDVTCESKYSAVEPSTDGEVIFRVLPPHIHIANPHSPDVQNLLKMTNLRINFTKLHTLGDNLLDSRREIKEKYYYAVHDMVVRGSCSCYGHASQCIADDSETITSIPDMVYGKCQCTHDTMGLNCESCKPLYNDQPWKPASETNPNPCRLCNCNNHADRCHFDPAVWERSGRVSGGVCEDCRDNTMGINCEMCVPFFFKDPLRNITDPFACKPCDCDPRGSLDDGVCDPHDDPAAGLVAGRCHCKGNVESRRCDRCKRGHYNFQAGNPEGCQPCTCHELGTIGDGCNVYSGECTCKRFVVGRNCDQCQEFYWGLSQDDDGCKPCDCDPGGAYDNHCDLVTGMCSCRPNIQGRRCDQPDTGYFVGNIDFMRYEAELARGSPSCQVVVREPYADREPTWTGLGFMQVHEDSYLEFDVGDVPTSMEYDIVFRYEPKLPRGWEEAVVTVERSGPVDPTGPCANWIPGSDRHVITFPAGDRHAVTPPVCLEKGKRYKVRIDFKQYDREVDTPKASVLVDSMVLFPRVNQIPFFIGTPANEYRREEFERFRCGHLFYSVRTLASLPEVCKKYLYSIGYLVFDGAQQCDCDPQGSHSSVCSTLGGQCQCKANVVGRRCDRCAPGTYDFGPGGCRPCDCNSIGSLDNFCNEQTGQCVCRPNTYGRQCDECQPGYWNYPSCQRCDCHGHAETCDSKTGHCIGCRDFTAGPHCERCEIGFYGDPRYGSGIPCRPCSCPGTPDSGVSHASGCDLDPRTGKVVCHCSPGYVGERCDRCANNYYGEPSVPGGMCRHCDCNGNTDETVPGNCDARTGECLRCLYNTEGPHCERCKPGHYGDASQQQCIECVCNILGMDASRGYCDPVTGQCPCLPNVVGKGCDRCAPNFWKIASGVGCEACDCDPGGSYEGKCNEFDGQCPCKPGHGGRRCNECQANHWGDPRVRCYPCECSVPGAAQAQCHHNNGSCVCIPGVSGNRCQECARGFMGDAPYCRPCGECFDNWDRIIQDLREETRRLIDAAKQIKQTGATGAYTKEFVEMERKLNETEEILNGANITGLDLADRQSLVEEIRRNLTESQNRLDEVTEHMNNVTQRIYNANLRLTDLHLRAQDLSRDAKALEDNTTALQEANVEGAFNITKEAQVRSRAAEDRVRGSKDVLYQSETVRRLTERMLEEAAARYNTTYHENERALRGLQQDVSDLEAQIPDLNEMVCFKRSTVDYCDPICGGAGCDKCGGLGCEEGAVTRANSSLALAQEITGLLEQKEVDARQLFAGVSGAKSEADVALDEAKKAFARAQLAKNQTENISADLDGLLDRIERFLSEAAARPAEIRVLAEECLGLSISLKPEQIRDLAKEINDTIASLTDIDAILRETAPDLALAKALKDRADRAKGKADKILDTARQVLKNLEDAKQAQDRAEEAINEARSNIATAQGDLFQIETETSGAQGVANRSLDDVAGLQDRLAELKKRFTQNQLDSRKAIAESDNAGRLADKAEDDARVLEDKYQMAMDALQSKSVASGDVKDRAEKLKERARSLAEDVTFKTQELQEMEDEFDENERRLKDYSKILEQLNREMMDHLNLIEKRSTHYRECQT